MARGGVAYAGGQCALSTSRSSSKRLLFLLRYDQTSGFINPGHGLSDRKHSHVSEKYIRKLIPFSRNNTFRDHLLRQNIKYSFLKYSIAHCSNCVASLFPRNFLFITRNWLVMGQIVLIMTSHHTSFIISRAISNWHTYVLAEIRLLSEYR